MSDVGGGLARGLCAPSLDEASENADYSPFLGPEPKLPRRPRSNVMPPTAGYSPGNSTENGCGSGSMGTPN
jgi:hypothetical protein